MSAAMGRPKLAEGDARKVYPLRLSPNEIAVFKVAAEAQGIPLPDWIRKTLTDSAENIKRNTESGADGNRARIATL